MKAVILAGGHGTRLRPYTFVVPKPLLPVGDKPVLQIIVEHLGSHGIHEIVVATGYLGELIKSYFKDGSAYGAQISYLDETKPLGTAGPLAMLRERLSPGEPFVVMNGDILTKLDFTRVIHHHSPDRTDLSIGVKRLEQQSPYGVLRIEDGRLLEVREKPISVEYINAGIYLVNERVLQEIPEDTYYTMPDLVNMRLEQGRPVDVFTVDEPWLALEGPQHLEEANREPEHWTTPGERP
ncbi:MAG TPA: sugar phosphate nucleotidyltransferase [Acidimicrobiales bacterium]|nr:sugar phosphate nucleotidyltransferase [Acidimicrobiales bacterium]